MLLEILKGLASWLPCPTLSTEVTVAFGETLTGKAPIRMAPCLSKNGILGSKLAPCRTFGGKKRVCNGTKCVKTRSAKCPGVAPDRLLSQRGTRSTARIEHIGGPNRLVSLVLSKTNVSDASLGIHCARS